MQPGSLVVVLKSFPKKISSSLMVRVKWLPIPDEETVYTIRRIIPAEMTESGNGPGAYLEEGQVGFDENFMEIAIALKDLREIQPPEKVEMSQLLEEEQLV